MALNSLAKFTIANGARDLNEDIHTIGTPTWQMFDQKMNKTIEPGDVVTGNVLYKDEMFQLGDPGSRDTIGDEFLDPYEHFELPWTYSVIYFNVDARKIQRNLGRFKVSDLQNRSDVLQSIPEGSRNTLVNMLAPRFRNMRNTLVKRCAKHFFEFEIDSEGRESPRGIDEITMPDSDYAGLKYNGLRQADWYSSLMGVYPELWNPLHKALTRQISIQDYIAAADDIAMMDNNAEEPQSDRPWVNFLMSRARYSRTLEWPLFGGDGVDPNSNAQRRRSDAGDTEIGATNQFVHTRLKMRFITDPNMVDDGLVYFWKEGSIKKRMQYEQNFPDMIEITRSWNQPILKIAAEFEYQYLCTQRISTGRITTTEDLA